jgi:hypothetical protein
VDAATLAAESLLDMDRVGAACSKIPGATSGEYRDEGGAVLLDCHPLSSMDPTSSDAHINQSGVIMGSWLCIERDNSTPSSR